MSVDKEYKEIMLQISSFRVKKEPIKILIDKIEYLLFNINDEKKSTLRSLRYYLRDKFVGKTVISVFKEREKNIFTLEQILDINYFPGE